MNEIKVLQCCENCKWCDVMYEGMGYCNCPSAFGRVEVEVDKYGHKNLKKPAWIYDCNAKPARYANVMDYRDGRKIEVEITNQCEYWENFDEEERKKERLRETIRMVLECGCAIKEEKE